MKKNVILLLWACLLMVTASCSREAVEYENREENGSNNGTPGTAEMVELNLRGAIQLQVGVNSASAATRATEVSTDDFIVILYKESGTKVDGCEWKYSEMPELVSVQQGNYYVKVKSHEMQPLDFKPYYEGQSDVFAVTQGAITEVNTIICEMANIRVEVVIDVSLDKYITSDASVVIKVGDANYAFNELTNSEANFPVYFAPTEGESSLIYATFEGTIDGFKEKMTQSKSAKAGEYVKVEFTLKNVTDGEVTASGNVSLKLALDMSLTVFDKDYNIEGGEEVLPEDPDDGGDEDGDETKPIIKGRGFNILQAQDVPKDGMACIVDITAANRISNLEVTIDSETLTESVLTSVGLLKSFDLAYPGNLEESLGGLGFPVGDKVIGQKSLVFDISPFTVLLNIYGAATHKFIIKVTDQSGVAIEQVLTLVTK